MKVLNILNCFSNKINTRICKPGLEEVMSVFHHVLTFYTLDNYPTKITTTKYYHYNIYNEIVIFLCAVVEVLT